MAKRHTNRVAWGLAAILAAGVLAGLGPLGIWLRWYWVAKHHGQGADLRGADLVGANLLHANLAGASRTHADLVSAPLRGSSAGMTIRSPGRPTAQHPPGKTGVLLVIHRGNPAGDREPCYGRLVMADQESPPAVGSVVIPGVHPLRGSWSRFLGRQLLAGEDHARAVRAHRSHDS